MRPLVITGTCKELHQCAMLLTKLGYIANYCHFPTLDVHESGVIVLNREGEFSFYNINPFPNYEGIVNSTDFLKSYGGFTRRTPYSFKTIYLIISLGMLLTGYPAASIEIRIFIIGLVTINIILYWNQIKKWKNEKRKKRRNTKN